MTLKGTRVLYGRVVASLFVTTSPNDDSLAKALGSMAVRAPTPFGDVNFWGSWEDSDRAPVSIRICVERKRVRDMVSCILSGRYLNQVQSAFGNNFDRLVLIVEGEIKPARDGFLVTRRESAADLGDIPFVSGRARRTGKRAWYVVEPGIQYSRFDRYLDELHEYCGILVKRSLNVVETAAQVKALWLLYQKPPSKHSSLEVVYRQPPPRVELLQKPSLLFRVAAELPLIGWDRAKAVSESFSSLLDALSADETRWRQIPGIGKDIAHRVVTSIRSPKGGT